MKTLVLKSVLVAFFVLSFVLGSSGQRVIKGTVYREGKPAAGVTVEAHRGSNTAFTDFDGKYEVTTDDKAKWIRFTFIDDSKKLDLTESSGNEIDFSFDGKIPEKVDADLVGVNLKSLQELVAANELDFMNNLSMYGEFYKQKDYKSAMAPWQVLYHRFPKSTLNVYIHGANMFESYIENAANKAEKQQYLDSLMRLYDRRIRFFDQKGYVLGRKGTAWLKYNLPPAEDVTDEELSVIYQKGYDNLLASAKEQGNETEIPVLVLLMQTSKSLLSLGKLPKEDVVRNYDMVATVLGTIEKSKPETEGLADARNAVEMIFGTSGAADCESLIRIYTPQFEEKSGDLDFLKTMLRRLARAGCDDSPLFFNASEKMYHLEPSAEAAFNMARMFVKQNDAEKAKTYYRQAMEQETDQSLLKDYNYEYALFIYAKENNFQEARNYARKALAIDPNHCKALMLIGDIYAASARSFSSDDFERSTVFWIAVDYFTKAKAGEDCFAEASKKANTYRGYFPNKETAFFQSIKEGDTYRVGGWINEVTRVRF
jgi:tetratricopeptide (TPR) repeat protein